MDLINGLELKPYGKPIKVDPRGQKGPFWNFQKKKSENHGFSVKKKKLLKNSQKIPNSSETCSRHNLLLFLSYELIATRFWGFLAVFGKNRVKYAFYGNLALYFIYIYKI